jgi:hypothetical protein
LLAGALYSIFPESNYDQDFSMKELSSIDSTKVYIKQKTWGITGDNQIIVISDSKDREFSNDVDKIYFYQGLTPFFYKLENDTLSIYTSKASAIPRNLKTTLKIVQYVLDNPKMMNLVENDNYKKLGLETIK